MKSLIHDYFKRLGLEPEIADIYLALHEHGPQTISELSRTSGVERTRIYRLLENLTTTALVEVETDYKRSLYRAAPISNLRLALAQKEQELKSLQDGIGVLEATLAPQALSSPATHVQFYRGAEGAKQMFWNETKAKTDIVAILYENMQIKTNGSFFERWVEKCNAAGLHFRGIISDEFIASQQTWYAMHHNERLEHWTPRYVSKQLFPITHSTIVYDNVVAYFNWKDGEIFGIEIYNEDIARSQRRFFEQLWAQASVVDE